MRTDEVACGAPNAPNSPNGENGAFGECYAGLFGSALSAICGGFYLLRCQAMAVTLATADHDRRFRLGLIMDTSDHSLDYRFIPSLGPGPTLAFPLQRLFTFLDQMAKQVGARHLVIPRQLIKARDKFLRQAKGYQWVTACCGASRAPFWFYRNHDLV